MIELSQPTNKSQPQANKCEYEKLSIWRVRFTPSTNYNQFLPCPGLSYSRYGIVHSERLDYQLWQRPLKMASTVYETDNCSGGTESFVGISRQKQHLRPLCGTICKCEFYCLSKRSRHFIDQKVITFHTFWDLISLHRKNALKYILLYFSKLEFRRMRHTFPVRLQRVFLPFRWNLARMLLDNAAKKRYRGIVIFGRLRK